MKTILSSILIVPLLATCNMLPGGKEESVGLKESMGLLAFRGNRVTVSGSVVKGVIKNATTTITPLAADGTCLENAGLIRGTTDAQGSYSLTYNRTGSVVCLIVTPSPAGNTTMYDEKSQIDLPVAPTSKFKMVMLLPESKIQQNSRTNVLVSPFSRIIAKRVQYLVGQSNGNADIGKLYTKASKELVIRFGLNSGLSGSSSRSQQKNLSRQVSDADVPELDDILLQLNNPSSSLTAKFISVLVGISHLANKYKNGGEVSVDDLDSIIEAFSADFADGTFDGKGPGGAPITIGSGANQITFSGDPLATVLLPSIVSYFQEGGTLSVGLPSSTPPPVLSPSTITSQVQFAGTVSIVSEDPTGFTISYPNSPHTILAGLAMSPIAPVVSGAVISNCSISPSLPSGLSLSTNCTISGTPISTQAATTYNITATSGSVSSNTSISITINTASPSGLSYTDAPYTFIETVSAAALAPTVSGSITSCSASPALPAGLSLNQTNCQISGTPSTSQSSSSYTITASNAYGNTNTSINITINPKLNISYSSSNLTFTNGTTISSLTPTVTNGPVTGYSISTTLPAGLSFNTSTGVISGTPSTTSTNTAYTINATSASNGTASFIMNITVNQMPAPSGLSYAGNPYYFLQNQSVGSVTPTVTGTVSSCTASGLPAGLSINSSNCTITGTPTTIQGATPYTITASNLGGNTTFNLTITVSDLPAQCFSYTSVSGDDRHAGVTGSVNCDQGVMNGSWVRFTGSYNRIATSVANENYCNTHAPGYMTTAHPGTRGQVIAGTVCYNFSGNTCNWTNGIQITNCDTFYVYQLPAPTSCNLRYCSGI